MMEPPEISADVRELINRHLPSLDHIEILLRLRASDEGLDPVLLRQATGFDQKVLDRCLADLRRSGLIAEVQDSSTLFYRYAPQSPELRRAIDELAVLHNTRPVTLVRAVYARPSVVIQTFADAFRIRRPEDK